MVDGRRVIAVDGKTLRGAKDAAGHHTQLLVALDQASGVLLGQVEFVAKTTEAAGGLGFPHAVQVLQVRHTVTRGGRRTIELVYLVTSMPMLSAAPQQSATPSSASSAWPATTTSLPRYGINGRNPHRP